MLKKIHPIFAFHSQALTNSIYFLLYRPFSSLITILVIAITLTLPALCWVFADNLSEFALNLKKQGYISLYLKPSLTEKEERDFLEVLTKTVGVDKAILKTRAEGLSELQKQEGMEDILHYLPKNPLPALIEVTPDLKFSTPEKIKDLFENLKNLAPVDQAKLDMAWITKLYSILNFVANLAKGLMIVLACALILIIGNTLRLVLHQRRNEIQILKFLGATDSYILRPFLYSGIWYGLIGAIFAVLFVNIFMLSMSVAFRSLAETYHLDYSLLSLTVKQAYTIVIVAGILGWLGARFAVKGQMASIEPYN